MTDETVETCVKCGNPCTGGSRFSQTVDKAGNLLSETHTCFTCADAEDLADYCKTDVIRTKMMTRGVILVHQIQEALKRVVDECDAKSAALFARLVAGEDVPLDDPTRQEFERIVDGIRGRLTLDEVAPLGRIHESTGHIEDEVAKFETDVWFGGAVPLQAMIQSAGKKGHAASFTDSDGREISVLSYAMCGRWMGTLESPEGSISIITAEDEPQKATRYMGIQGIGSTEGEAIKLLNETVAAWKNGDLVFRDNENVRLAGM